MKLIMTNQMINEMNDCLKQIEKLIEDNNKAKEVIKRQDINKNFKVMSDLLDKYEELVDEIEREKDIEVQYNSLERILNSRLVEKIETYNFLKNIKPPHTPQQSEKIRMDMRIRGIIEYNYKDIEQLCIMYEPTNEEKKLYELYNNKQLIQERYFALINKRTSAIYFPTYYMKQYNEAIYNMFLIQQKRIDELENKINQFTQ